MYFKWVFKKKYCDYLHDKTLFICSGSCLQCVINKLLKLPLKNYLYFSHYLNMDNNDLESLIKFKFNTLLFTSALLS